ncbi:MAG: bifunctional riboflavin kinase/FAD synthetase [Casimicrobiaceae bacterium]
MRIIRGLPRQADSPIALTIGNFDGVHRGHQAMLARLSEAAEDLRLIPAVLTFDPHPREFFAPDRAPPRISTRRAKFERLREAGVRRTVVARFDATLARMSPQAFVEDVLVTRLGVRWLLVGNDFRFGKDRTGDVGVLRRCARTFSIECMQVVEVDGERASSTAIREALAHGDIARATALIGRPYAIAGRVAHGDKRGRALGFPTANIALQGPGAVRGIFAVRVHGLGATARTGVASIGVRPTIANGGKPLLEVHVFDFDEPIYGKRISVELLHKLRDEARYATLEALTSQIRTDVAQARDWFSTHPD